MLDQATKRKIDSARDILVGKVPDPKAQVEQITTALIYKFMDDMDKENKSVDLKAQYFVDGFSKYGWDKLLDSRLSGQERLDLYMEAITKMPTNRHIPQLFRDIFKGAFLPYRDPQTLSLFLKEIDGFAYDHSENLGNAFEYLLSILGSQGDAGQFRTPRHIIDFIVEVVAPKKEETILDPACGTAGFLISAYKHIYRSNSSKQNNRESNRYGDLLTPADKKKLMTHIAGYDIAPDMVKLSLVNMYLHGFASPKIYEYDTLTNEQRWNEQFDVILANPPFMSPKGGIRPHKKFAIQATRSEVLFVDYILEHLNFKGRAGIIVPEGIIFKADSAYKQLRRILIEDGLFAVVSLPPGVFKPYSGVKTNILFFDNQRAKKTNEILFLKIGNDGFALGDTRRKIEKNDLPKALEILTTWKEGGKKKSNFSLWVKKEKIAGGGNYNLIGERYKQTKEKKHKKWALVELREVLDYEQPTKYIVKSTDYNNCYETPVLTAGKTFILGYTDEKDGIVPKDKLPVIIFDDFTTAIKFVNFPFKVKSSAMKILHAKKEQADIYFLFHTMNRIKFSHNEHKRYWISEYSKIKIPLPPLEVQKEIVEQIKTKQHAIDHAKEVIKNLERERRYFGQEINGLKSVEKVALGMVCDILDYLRKPVKKADRNEGEYPYYGATGILDYVDDYIFNEKLVLVGEDGAKWQSGEKTAFVATGKYWVNNHAHVLRPDKSRILDDYLVQILNWMDLSEHVTGVTVPKLNQTKLKSIKIPLPALKIQRQLIADAEKEEEIIASNRRLIELMQAKIDKTLSDF